MKECFDYQASPRLDMTFQNLYKENIFILFYFIFYYFFRELKPTKKTPF